MCGCRGAGLSVAVELLRVSGWMYGFDVALYFPRGAARRSFKHESSRVMTRFEDLPLHVLEHLLRIEGTLVLRETCRTMSLPTTIYAVMEKGHRRYGGDRNLMLFMAAEKGCYAVVTELVKGGVDVNWVHEDEGGLTALMVAACEGHTQVVDRLLRAGAFVDAREVSGATALMYASAMGQTAVVDLMRGQTLPSRTNGARWPSAGRPR